MRSLLLYLCLPFSAVLAQTAPSTNCVDGTTDYSVEFPGTNFNCETEIPRNKLNSITATISGQDIRASVRYSKVNSFSCKAHVEFKACAGIITDLNFKSALPSNEKTRTARVSAKPVRNKPKLPTDYVFFINAEEKPICFNRNFQGNRLTSDATAGSHIMIYDVKDKPLQLKNDDWLSAAYLVTERVTGWPDKGRIGFLARNMVTNKYFALNSIYQQSREFNSRRSSVPMFIADFDETSKEAEAWAIIPETNKDTFLTQLQPERLKVIFLGIHSIPFQTQQNQIVPERGYEAVEPGQPRFYPSQTKRPSVYLLDCP